MLHCEQGAMELVEKAILKYKEYFKQPFLFYEYSHITENDEYDVSLAGAKKFVSFIDKRIESNAPVDIPDGYFERKY
ncbi:MAG TPA: hypothetical protein GX525_05925 [Bacilli bacterium]|nr:hypothetical protein [Bacilli bacterium]